MYFSEHKLVVETDEKEHINRNQNKVKRKTNEDRKTS